MIVRLLSESLSSDSPNSSIPYATKGSVVALDPSTMAPVPSVDFPPLRTARYDAAAATLPDGRIVVAGGFKFGERTEEQEMTGRDAGVPVSDCEIFNPVLRSWTAIDMPPIDRNIGKVNLFVVPKTVEEVDSQFGNKF